MFIDIDYSFPCCVELRCGHLFIQFFLIIFKFLHKHLPFSQIGLRWKTWEKKNLQCQKVVYTLLKKNILKWHIANYLYLL